MIKAMTFDLWDTIVVDDSDEVERKKKGLRSKVEERLYLLREEVQKHHPDITNEKIGLAFKSANDKFNVFWKQKHVTPTVAERLGYVFEELKLKPTPGFGKLVHAVEYMEVEFPPVLCEGIAEALAELSKLYKLAIISDAIHTPGKGLREILKKYQLISYFNVFVFSDEAKAAKPDAKVFQIAQQGLGVDFSEIAHIGDRESNDVEGPLKMGMKSILYTGAIDRGSSSSKASAVCKTHRDLVKIVKGL
ncbi:MAG: hypothetical protein A4S09_11360 [Proteobacteria bacterium SG_bin7]|nr:MAG: hypothetical protein A4S09_11360 [Proteobacteria bacterium SG_bin7]